MASNKGSVEEYRPVLRIRAYAARCHPFKRARVLTSSNEYEAAVTIVGLTGVLIWRVREGRTAVTVKKIIMPPLGMSTGFAMFFLPVFRVPWLWGMGAFLIGATVFAYPLLLTSSLRREGSLIMMRRSGAFFAVIIALALIRYFARDYFDSFISLEQTGSVFYLLAFGMILHWRVKLLLLYRALVRPAPSVDEPANEAAIGESEA